ncbi:nadh:ubiquinone oxidoreductase [Lucifera butyrica]|uniref:Nadh:ubiquinone oxidoreductase n=1 Tax=Lucifera butyrica TaxID=1351585 RepID=A0A498R6F7_9FIRM|nr:proton-conducting transporter membrane subunit [Lucifera butyrica]VBB06769.1 nadh:ubiquinone oxidoreductase [Lucifera butyrica]
MLAADLYFLTGLFFLIGAMVALILYKKEYAANWIAHGMATAGSISAILCAIVVFWQGTARFPLFEWPLFGQVTVGLDYLSAFFLLLVGLLGAPASVYAIGYCREFYGRRLWLTAACYNLFLLSMVAVFTVSHVVAFLVAWEVMSLVSFFLVNHRWEEAENRRAAYVYLVMTHVGTAFIIAAFLLLAVNAGSFDFQALGQAGVKGWLRDLIFLFALLGFGTKAGLVPVHIWLPMAHPAAPSHVSALMSGIMIKTAVYGLSRFLLVFLGSGPAWWGQLVVAVGILSCLLGVLYAVLEQDLKRLLAYSTVENAGIILLGMGSGLIFTAGGHPVLAGFAWSAAFLHTFNHAIFKSLLFLSAGTVVQATHTHNLEKMGGLIKKMPVTAVFFLIGAVTIASLPPLSGFVSEWLTFQSLFYLPQGVDGLAGQLAGTVLPALLGMAGALAAGAFVKAFGIAFLAKPRSPQAEKAGEAPGLMTAPLGLLAAICIVTGIWPEPVLKLVTRLLSFYPQMDVATLFQNGWFGLSFGGSAGGGWPGIPVAAGLVAAGLTGGWLLAGRNRKERECPGETWTCGIVPNSRMAYTATGFSKPIRTAFRAILQPQRHKVVAGPADNAYYGRRLTYSLSLDDILRRRLYRPFNSGVIAAAKYVRKLQNGSLQLYIGYILAVTVMAIIWSSR